VPNITITGGKIEVNEAVRMLLTGHLSRFTIEKVEDGPRSGWTVEEPGETHVMPLGHGERQVTLAYSSERL